jgi:hypothetical protein
VAVAVVPSTFLALFLLAALVVALFKMVAILREVEHLVKETLAAHIQVMKQVAVAVLLLLVAMLLVEAAAAMVVVGQHLLYPVLR